MLVLIGLCSMTLLINFIQAFYFLSLRMELFSRKMFMVLLEDTFLSIIILLGYTIFILASTNYFFKQETKPVKVLIFHLFFSTLSGLFAYILAFSISLLLGSVTLEDISSFNHLERVFAKIDTNFLIYFSILSVVYIYHYYKQFRESEFKRFEINNKLTLSNLNLIQSQLEPHFLFNSLNAVSSLIHTDKERATTIISDLGDVLRETLMLRDTQFITIEEEIQYLKKYMNILQTRFDDQITFDVEKPDTVNDLKVPALLLQPIIENAIKHGLKDGQDKIKIRTDISLDNKLGLIISVKNSGIPIDQNSSEKNHHKKGIDIITERLNLIYGENFTFELKNLEHQEFNVEAYIRIFYPIEKINLSGNEY